MFKKLIALIALCTSTALAQEAAPAAPAAEGPVKRTLCVYDPSGQNGDMFNVMKDYRTAAIGWGVEFELIPYKNEKQAADDMLAGKCDGSLITGVRGRSIHPFAGSIEALGALPTYAMLKSAIAYYSDARLASDMRKDDWEVASIYPGGLVNLFVHDRNLSSVDQLKGKKFATMDFDEAASTMIAQVGGVIEQSDLSSFAKLFNEGKADVAYAPVYAFKALELEKGVGKNGGIIRYPVAQLTMQLILKSDKFAPEFGQKSREYAYSKFNQAKELAASAEKKLPKDVFIDISAEDQVKYDKMLQTVRIQLRDKKIYSGKALKAMAKIRCKADAQRPECAEKLE